MSEHQLPQEHYLQIDEVWNNFIEQLMKDALLAGIEMDKKLFNSKSLQEIIQHISKFLNEIQNTNNGFEKIQNWSYRVDISEKKIKEQSLQNKKYSHIIAEQIVKRTLQKVVIRYLHKLNKL